MRRLPIQAPQIASKPPFANSAIEAIWDEWHATRHAAPKLLQLFNGLQILIVAEVSRTIFETNLYRFCSRAATHPYHPCTRVEKAGLPRLGMKSLASKESSDKKGMKI
jgi:hypothetical protein